MALGALGLSFSVICVKTLYLHSKIAPFEVSYVSGIAVLIVMSIMAMLMGKEIIEVPKTARFALILRGLSGFISNIFFQQSIKMISLTKQTLLFFTNPMFVALFAWIFLKERITKYEILQILATFCGVILIMNPLGETTTKDTDFWHELLGSFFALLAAVFNATAMISIRKAGSSVNILMSPIYWGIFNSLLSPFMGILKANTD